MSSLKTPKFNWSCTPGNQSSSFKPESCVYHGFSRLDFIGQLSPVYGLKHFGKHICAFLVLALFVNEDCVMLALLVTRRGKENEGVTHRFVCSAFLDFFDCHSAESVTFGPDRCDTASADVAQHTMHSLRNLEDHE
eukprot:2513285-Amphidinium_carterae.1